jgi:multiple sugar transport system ATP-binding protein
LAKVGLSSISKSFGPVSVLNGIDLDIADGEFMTLVGPSGCGKSTLIRIIAGLEPQDAGTVSIGGQPVDHLRPHERKVAMVFQSYALYPHMTAGANIGLPLMMQRLDLWERVPLLRLLSARRRRVLREVEAEVGGVARLLQLENLLQRRPSQLSGGQRQRVALGRAIVRHPQVFLMDEPLSNLDAKLRVHMRTELAELHERLGVTFIYVTHDQVEAMTMSTRVAMMDSGSIMQVGLPSELYKRPANLKVAQFIGSPAINLLPGGVAPDRRVTLFGRPLPLAVAAAPGARLIIGLRPEALAIRPGPPGLGEGIPVRLGRTENLGSEAIVHVETATPEAVKLAVKAAPDAPLGEGEAHLVFDPAACHLFGEDGARLPLAHEAPPSRAAMRAGAGAAA